MSNVIMTPRYDTKLFSEIWDDAAEFKADYNASPFKGAISSTESATTKDNVSLLYYLLYAKYGNSPIANYDIEQFKYKVFGIIWQYGPTWEKRLDIQEKLRSISDDPTASDNLFQGSKAIYNNALNPSTAPTTGSLEELKYINAQNTTNYKKSKMEAYSQLWELLKVDVTNEFMNKFKICFKTFVMPEKTWIYVTEEDGSDE